MLLDISMLLVSYHIGIARREYDSYMLIAKGVDLLEADAHQVSYRPATGKNRT